MEIFDVVIVGGGIIGAGIARDAALRGLHVALLERADFGGGTTAGSTRLIHGGLRYLEMLDFRLVRMDLRERETLLRIAPHLVKPLEFLLPLYSRSLWYRLKLRAGMVLYDALSFDKSLPKHRFLTARETLAAEPRLSARGLQGAAVFYDCQVESPERLCLENVLDAREHGATAWNYREVTGALREGGRIAGVRARDVLDGGETEVRGRVVVNASGPWFDRVAGILEPQAHPAIRTTKGVHIACSPVNQRANVLFSGVDGRLFFVIPLLGYSWIGTTDTDFQGDPCTARADSEDADYLLRSAAGFFPDVRDAEVFWSNAGVRALVRQRGRPSSVSREHRIVDGPDGMVSVL
ncbi:MAG: glycerol-3-phosphate dehydrogenase/oxidase, partial [Acidobacteria bacterium]|nr:glycerol-3-phosphate dehydrogenase/oxidase [Acidobacteriota bacterium]